MHPLSDSLYKCIAIFIFCLEIQMRKVRKAVRSPHEICEPQRQL